MFKKIYKIHVYLGLIVAVHFVIFALTGMILLFQDEVENGFSVNENQMTIESLNSEQVATGYEKISEYILKKHSQDRLIALFPDEGDYLTIHARVGMNGSGQLRGARKLQIKLEQDFATVRVDPEAKTSNSKGKFFEIVLELHREFFLGSYGKLYVGLIGFLYVLMLVTGFYLYGNFMKGRTFREIRTGEIFKNLDYHKFFGAVTFGWALVVGLSGTLLAFNGVLIKIFQKNTLEMLNAEYAHVEHLEQIPQAPLKKVFLSALEAKPDMHITYISFPDTEFGLPNKFLFLMNGRTPLTEKISEVVVIDAQTANLVRVVELPLYLKMVMLSEPLHFGNYGGLYLKGIWLVFTFFSLVVALLGFYSFFRKRRKVKVQSVNLKQDLKLKQNIKNITVKKETPLKRYIIPVGLACVTLISLTTALFTTGQLAGLALVLMLIPFVCLFVYKKKNTQ
ncbi:MAG: PepSY-associated TM helix domain-containing protein [Pseudobdellovibrio sp.]